MKCKVCGEDKECCELHHAEDDTIFAYICADCLEELFGNTQKHNCENCAKYSPSAPKSIGHCDWKETMVEWDMCCPEWEEKCETV